jgi:hypothetical protein
MSTTLTNGLKLPDKGSVDWYADMQSNYTILDGAVGTVAEHTTALAGKASLVHTHTKSDITDFPAYGTTAGTICEGNDSRLSDARTPVSHTHLTSDVTDLLNSAHTWTAQNTYTPQTPINIRNNSITIGTGPSAYTEQGIKFSDSNNAAIGSIKYENNSGITSNWFANGIELCVLDKFKDGVRDPTGTITSTVLRIGLWNDGTKYIYNEGRWRSAILPFATDSYNLGTSSYQWNNLYAKNYYYNGVAWGLDKLNVWGNTQVISGGNDKGLDVINKEIEKGVVPSAAKSGFIWFKDKDNTYLSRICHRVNTNGSTILWLSSLNYYKNGVLDPTGSSVTTSLVLGVDANAYKFVQTNADFRPDVNNTVNLGTSTNKWKSFNGINPGALSFPSNGTTENTDWFNVAGGILPTGGNATDFTGGQNFFTPSKDGWLCLVVKNCSYISVWDSSNKMGQSLNAPDTTKNQQILLPVLANNSLEIRIIGSSWYAARLIMPKGNV